MTEIQTLGALNWHFGIGDPNVFGWLTVAGYLAAAYLCNLVAKSCRRAKRSGRYGGSHHFWFAAAACLVLLGFNKQLDLHILFTEIARNIARADGWYTQRHILQRDVMIFAAALGSGIALFLGYLIRRAFARQAVALMGLLFLFGFVMLRAASLHRVDNLLGVTFAGMTTKFLLEFGGIAIVGVAAIINLRLLPGAVKKKPGKADLMEMHFRRKARGQYQQREKITSANNPENTRQ